MKSIRRPFCALLSLILTLSMFAGCGRQDSAGSAPNPDVSPPAEVIYEEIDPADVVEHQDRTSVYETIGRNITIDMVREDPDTGLAFVEYGGVTYELGMDFLSHAMVYNCTVPEGSAQYATSEDVYNQWWKLYIQRWNYLVPEAPLYSNQYFDLYNAKIQNFITSPYWGPSDAIIAASIREGEDNSVILGNATDLSGAFRNAAWGKASPSGSDLDIQQLTTGHATLQTDINGAFVWNAYVVEETPVSVRNGDGTLTYTIKIREGLVFSDGSPITAKNYIASLLANSTDVAAAAGGTGAAGQVVAGYEAFNAFDGTNEGALVGEGSEAVTASRYFSGVKLLDDYTFSVTYQEEYADYYYVISYAAFTPDPLALYLGKNDIILSPDGACGLSDDFYTRVQKDGADVYAMADVITRNLKWDSGLPYSGPYVISDYDPSTLTATLMLNPHYPGDTARGTPSIDTISYVKMVAQTQTDMFKTGQIDILAGVTGAAETEGALALLAAEPGRFGETHYDRAGYGKLGFRCDFGPTGMTEVRQAIMYTINRPEFAQTFTGGYGSVIHGPYYSKFSAYTAKEEEILLNQYAYSADTAIHVLEAGGWIYNGKGQPFVPGTDAVRYKKLSGYELSHDNLYFATVDGKYRTVKINGAYYMPLAINWYGNIPNPFTDLLITAWQTNPNATEKIGMYITYTGADFNTALYGELLRMESYGYNGVPKLNALNYATSFNFAMYDYAWNWTLDEELQAQGYNSSFLSDEADFAENYR